MKDSKGRIIDYMRISITDRCNLRCRYCMPHGIRREPKQEILSMEEIQALATAAAALGIRRVKVTGGEPLVRRDCCRLVAMLKSVPGIEAVTITTNGVLLEKYLEPLMEAGIDGINVSLDTLDRETYRRITGQDKINEVLKALRAAAALPVPVKINAVSVDFGKMGEPSGGPGERPGWQALVELARDLAVDVRFIEMMPIGFGRQFETMNHKRLLEDIRAAYPGLERDETVHGFGPAKYYKIPGFMGSIGFISAIHGKFCGECNRVRITSKGYLKSCLCYEDGVDLRAVLRDGTEGAYEQAGTEERRCHGRLAGGPDCEEVQRRLKEAIRQAVWQKPAAHCFERPQDITESENMSKIGG
ncbi:MAG: GTP 3',8-cyclase MoaA [Hungatella sp.]|nr:GTP 3',8-cyclase MoaA [Hungatella sp.]